MNNIRTWQQGAFIDQPKYARMSDEWKNEQRRTEALLVRPGPKENAICTARDPEAARWIAHRLNLAAQLEQMTYDFATGKTDGSEIVALVRNAVA
ncbi:hypothetical protein [Aurantimonas phage AmM-1]|uniref:hypothetical protein n=1 Tax=Aurantimonas phage AmM-1 TaxID=1503929 RepID=UPI0005410D92|nr:hypothetical protein ACQ23_gp38 [Aurantimonas phage AmM-1]BAP94495.1 hypothetical protein [Aurantimonas phage AmM-1]